ncbi:glycosyltransferase (PssD)-like protein [Candidatus Thiomargarita nelsonii]|uniref:Glycosyltransferase (PssD)-like protein n=1 Tax=Candidatus Thiomargarita nelsonii TaxID=1003181 RepID=A0A176S5S3_9GAMM|nr:glycosyltransferase (PssD)-like protein [Candidatus Thiomargarita nelsonii]
MVKTPPKLLAISSGGGHWVEMLRLRPAFARFNVTYVTVSNDYAADVPGECFRSISDATRWNKVKLMLVAGQILWRILYERPDVVISTGAAPGYFALRFGKLIGARTVWLDSIANVDELSMAGQMAGRYADMWLTQWSHLAREGGPEYFGAVI